MTSPDPGAHPLGIVGLITKQTRRVHYQTSLGKVDCVCDYHISSVCMCWILGCLSIYPPSALDYF